MGERMASGRCSSGAQCEYKRDEQMMETRYPPGPYAVLRKAPSRSPAQHRSRSPLRTASTHHLPLFLLFSSAARCDRMLTFRFDVRGGPLVEAQPFLLVYNDLAIDTFSRPSRKILSFRLRPLSWPFKLRRRFCATEARPRLSRQAKISFDSFRLASPRLSHSL